MRVATPNLEKTKTFLDFLSEEDRNLLLANARRVECAPEEVILKEGMRMAAIFIIRSGEVRVERTVGDYPIELTRLGMNDIFGEMSFVDGGPSSADVMADNAVSLEVIDTERLKEIIKQDISFYGRFFHALSKTLSLRLRMTTDQAAGQLWDDVV